MEIPGVLPVARWLVILSLAVTAASAPVFGRSALSPGTLTGSLAAPLPGEAHIVSATTEGRRVNLEVDSPSVGRTAVSLLLPVRFESEPQRTWPVLYLLHGATNDHATWLEQTDVERLTADLDLLVVMPDGGDYGFYSDWWNEGAGGPPKWETWHLDELPALLEHDYRASDARAVAGESMGGFGAISYAARRPGMFRAAASFSGVLDIFALGRLGEDIWGDRQDQLANWQAHDPVHLAPALAGTALYVSWGDGEPGPLDDASARFDVVEAWISGGNGRFAQRLADLGLPATIDAYGPGTHTWPYWERALSDALPLLLAALEESGPS
jgi:diacylglycerol O-acyltransferase / trehalose O-mycolyltransferase